MFSNIAIQDIFQNQLKSCNRSGEELYRRHSCVELCYGKGPWWCDDWWTYDFKYILLLSKVSLQGLQMRESLLT